MRIVFAPFIEEKNCYNELLSATLVYFIKTKAGLRGLGGHVAAYGDGGSLGNFPRRTLNPFPNKSIMFVVVKTWSNSDSNHGKYWRHESDRSSILRKHTRI
jgi:hypothetical protein